MPTQLAITSLKLTMKTIEQWKRQLRHSGVFIVNFEHISDVALLLPLSIFNR